MESIENQIRDLIKEWKSLSTRPVDKDWVLSNIKSDPSALKEIEFLIEQL